MTAAAGSFRGRVLALFFALVFWLSGQPFPAAPQALADSAVGQHGMVVSVSAPASQVGVAVLQKGGNAVDAAVATAFAMTVVEPFMSSIGGSGTMLVHLARRGETVALDFNAVAPRSAHETMYTIIGGVSDAGGTRPRGSRR